MHWCNFQNPDTAKTVVGVQNNKNIALLTRSQSHSEVDVVGLSDVYTGVMLKAIVCVLDCGRITALLRSSRANRHNKSCRALSTG